MWRVQRIRDLWGVEDALEQQQHKLYMPFQPYRVDRHHDKARRAQELYFARGEIENALKYVRQQINAFEWQYMGDTGEGRLNRHYRYFGDPDILLGWRYRIFENGRKTLLDRFQGGSVYQIATLLEPEETGT